MRTKTLPMEAAAVGSAAADPEAEGLEALVVLELGSAHTPRCLRTAHRGSFQ